MTTGPNRAAEPCVERFDRIGRAQNGPNLSIVVKEGDELFPSVFPQMLNRWIFRAPFLTHRVPSLQSGSRARGSINRLDIAFEALPVLLGRVPERVTNQMQDTGVNCCFGPYDLNCFR